MNILLVGANGKMAKNVKVVNKKFKHVIFELDKNTENNMQFKSFFDISNEIAKKIDVVLDFSSPQVLKSELNFCEKHKIPLIICSTGQSKADNTIIKKYSSLFPIAIVPNTSLGIYLMTKMLKSILKNIKDFDIDLVESHHKLKKDAPSGTAKMLIKILENYDVNIHSIRAGEIVGTHEIILTSQYEQLKISHTAFDKKLFALGALNLCQKFQKTISPKLYSIEEILSS